MSSSSDTGTAMAIAYTIGQTVRVPTSLVDDNPFNARSIYDQIIVSGLARELRANGQLVAAVAVPSSIVPGRFTLIDGHYRLRALKTAGKDTILLDVHDVMPDVELFRLSFVLNEFRAPHTALDNALAWSRLLTTRTVATHGDLRAMTGKSLPTISKTLRMLELPSTVMNVVQKHPARFTVKLGYALAQICKTGGVEDAMRLAERASREEISTIDIQQAVTDSRIGKRVRGRRTGNVNEHVRGVACVGTIKRFESGRLSIDLLFTEPSRALEFVERVKQLVAAAT